MRSSWATSETDNRQDSSHVNVISFADINEGEYLPGLIRKGRAQNRNCIRAENKEKQSGYCKRSFIHDNDFNIFVWHFRVMFVVG